ncbi:MAG: VanZ family protein [Oscillospiraceae bacterium]|nr:VanZ family protein [Oscillospiraceae bacterium]
MEAEAKRSVGKTLLRIVFICYVVWMLWLLFGQRLGTEVYSQELAKSMNLKPFATIRHFIALLGHNAPGLVTHAVINLLGNVVMFVPLGFCLPKIFPKLRSFLKTFCLCVCIIVVVELVQYYTFLGTCDIDDLILNMVGVSIGYFFIKIKQH